MAGRLRAGQTVIVTPGSCGGALAFKKPAGLTLEDGSVRVAETHTLHYAVRVKQPGRIRVFLKLKAGNLLAALPSRYTEEVLALIADVYPTMESAKNVIQTSLQNANPVIHPAVTLANAARIEGTGGDFLFYEEGVGDATGRFIEAVDQERIAIGARVGRQEVSQCRDGPAFQGKLSAPPRGYLGKQHWSSPAALELLIAQPPDQLGLFDRLELPDHDQDVERREKSTRVRDSTASSSPNRNTNTPVSMGFLE